MAAGAAPKIALVHDHLVQDGGAERVLRVLMRMWPDAPVYTAYFDPKKMGSDFEGKDIRTSFLQKIPLARRFYKLSLPWLDRAFRRFDLREYHVVISSASAWAKSVQTVRITLHVCYCHTPTRYIWSDADSYIKETGYIAPLKWLFRRMLGTLRRKDLRGAKGVDDFVANSDHVAQRIKKYYKQPATVIPPPVDISKFGPSKKTGDYFLLAGRLEPYKRNDIVIEAANQLGVPLRVMGEGTDRPRLERLAGPTVRFLGRVSDAERRQLFAEAKALINPQEEDFGITVVEAMASGTPVLAFKRGGATEIVTAKTGAFFEKQTAAAVAEAWRRFRPERYSRQSLLARANQYAVPRFERELRSHVMNAYERFRRHEDRR